MVCRTDDDPQPAPEPGRPALGVGVRGLEAGEHVVEGGLLHPRRAVAAADDLPRPRRQGVLLLDPRQQPGDASTIGCDEARDLLQRRGADDRPRDPAAQRRARVPLLRRPAVAALQAPARRRAGSASRWSRRRAYLFQIAGPTSLETLERATGESLRDIGSCAPAQAKINGTTVEVGRIGMSGNLAYELRGPIEDGPEIYDAVFQGGQGPRHPAPRLAHVPRQPRRGRLPADELAVLQRRRPRPRLPGDGRRQRLQRRPSTSAAASTPPTPGRACAPRSRSAGRAP